VIGAYKLSFGHTFKAGPHEASKIEDKISRKIMIKFYFEGHDYVYVISSLAIRGDPDEFMS